MPLLGPSKLPDRSSRWRLLALICFVVLVQDFAEYIARAPQIEIWIEIVARKLCPGVQDGSGCMDLVQSEVALLEGWKDTLEQVPGILFAVPYGVLADRIGRRPVLLLCAVGFTLSDVWVKIVCWFSDQLPLRLIWLAPIAEVVGGGTQVATSIMFVMLADLFNDEDQTTAFLYVSATALLSEILATPLGTLLMTRNVWLPYILSSVGTAGGGLFLLLLPETLPQAPPSSPSGTSREEEADKGNIPDRVRAGVDELRRSTAVIRRHRSVQLFLFVFFAAYLGRQVMKVLLLFAANRFHWTIAQASFLISVRGFTNLLLLIVILPGLSRWLLRRWNMTPLSKDTSLALTSSACLCVGCLLIAVSVHPVGAVLGLVVFALGSAMHLLARRIITSLVDAHHLGTLYTAIAVMQGIGVVVAGPTMAMAYGWGLAQGGVWTGAPFLLVAGLFGAAGMAILLGSWEEGRGDLESG
ncbi:adenylate cyclase [Aspergillus sclerotioniger CBS 115572]|uniref:Adenylate cyclase n=1 Tax=Aspergillus sclerotioniger CBS 115572 TaxID=1450535 RepID=A0A317WVF5_9EURO|nr:adenylate cyclase [Aspergillus sclerotioniger CBS 115572]PWY90339.1 adenylate cyclase [Aspergillus sclerotioniger CBS 115572]